MGLSLVDQLLLDFVSSGRRYAISDPSSPRSSQGPDRISSRSLSARAEPTSKSVSTHDSWPGTSISKLVEDRPECGRRFRPPWAALGFGGRIGPGTIRPWMTKPEACSAVAGIYRASSPERMRTAWKSAERSACLSPKSAPESSPDEPTVKPAAYPGVEASNSAVLAVIFWG